MQPQAQYDLLLQICKDFSKDMFNSRGNVPRKAGRPSKCSDLQIIALSIFQESLNMGSERFFFEYLLKALPSLCQQVGTRRNYNARRRKLTSYIEAIRRRMVVRLNDYYGSQIMVVDSMPLPSCRYSRSKRCKIFKETSTGWPQYGYCATQQQRYYGYKFHCVCSASGIIQMYDLSPANVHDIHYLKDVKEVISNCVLIGDKGYRSNPMRAELFEFFGIELAVPCRSNELLQYTMPADYAKIRKRIEIIFSQLVDQMDIRKNYAKSQSGLHVRIISKVTLFTMLQYINMKKEKQINHIRYALVA